MWVLRRILMQMGTVDAMEFLLDKMKDSKSQRGLLRDDEPVRKARGAQPSRISSSTISGSGASASHCARMRRLKRRSRAGS